MRFANFTGYTPRLILPNLDTPDLTVRDQIDIAISVVNHQGSCRPQTHARDRRSCWLKNLREALRQELDAGTSCVLACSALKRAYREQIRDGLESVRFFYLKIDYEVVAKRLESRTGHFFEKKLLNSQFAILEEPDPKEAFLIDQNSARSCCG